MNFWYFFWLADFAVATCAFAVILVVVAVRGVGDLREMFAALRRDSQEHR
jgi:hypothetical protein